MFVLAASVPGRPPEKTQNYFNNLHRERLFFKRKKAPARVFSDIFSARGFFLHFFAVSGGFAFECREKRDTLYTHFVIRLIAPYIRIGFRDTSSVINCRT
jgi:hypothetical protein